MTSAESPFVAAAGARPPQLAGRSSLLVALDESLGLLGRAEPARPIAWVGRYGSGRSAILHEAARQAAAEGWAAGLVTMERGQPLEHELARGLAAALLHHGRRHAGEPKLAELLGVVKAFAAWRGLDLPLDAPHAEISWPGGRYADVGGLFEKIGDGLRSMGSGCLLGIDDAHFADPDALRDVLAVAGHLAQAGRALQLVVTALPGAVPAGSASVAHLDPLSPPEVLDALAPPAAEHGVEITHATVAAIGRRTGGHPYFVQAFAAAAWEKQTNGVITPTHISEVALEVEHHLAATFFAPACDGLSPRERDFLGALCRAGRGASMSDVAGQLADGALEPVSANRTAERDALLERGVIYCDHDDRLDFAQPYFDRYLMSLDVGTSSPAGRPDDD